MTLWFGVFLALLGATGIMRLGEMAVSAVRMARNRDAVVSEPWLFPLMALLHTGLVALPAAEVWFLHVPFRPWLAVLSGAVLVLATALRIWTLATIGRSWNVRVVVPEDIRIATTGPYRFIRHPNYLVVILEIAALPLFHGAWMSAIFLTLLNAFVLLHRIRTEEAALAQIPAWVDAMRDRARLLPGLF